MTNKSHSLSGFCFYEKAFLGNVSNLVMNYLNIINS